MSHAVLASKMTTPSSRVAAGETRIVADSQLAAQRQAKPYSGPVPSSASVSTAGSRTSSTVRSSERTERLSSRIRLASPSSKRLKADRRRVSDAGPAPRSRATATAEDTLCVSSNAARSASIWPRSNCRCPPAVRRGSGSRSAAPTTGACSR